MKKVFLKFIKIHMKLPVLEPLFNKVEGLMPDFIKKRDSDRCFSVNFARFLRTPFSQNIFG